MPEKYQEKYNIKSHRLQGYDYSSDGAYFITICTAKHLIEFGEIENGQVQLSQNGKIANDLWLEIPNKFPFIILDEFIVMPNHLHGILIINHSHDNVETRFITSQNNNASQNNTILRDTINRASTKGGITGKHNPMLHKNISRIVRWYKGRVSFEIHKADFGFAWQNNYYDVIIRNEKQFTIIENYIRNNPNTWDNDKFYTK